MGAASQVFSFSPPPTLHDNVNPQLAVAPDGVARDPSRRALVRLRKAYDSPGLHRGLHPRRTGFAS